VDGDRFAALRCRRRPRNARYDRRIKAKPLTPGESRRGARRRVQASPLDAAAYAGLTACALFSSSIAGGTIDGGRGGWFIASVAAVTAALVISGVAAWNRSGRSLRLLAISPFSLAAGTWAVLFVVRPLELYVAPHHAALSLAQLGFDLADLTKTVALAGLGCAAWGIGYLFAFGHTTAGSRVRAGTKPLVRSWKRAAIALAIGSALVGALFLRQGGLTALIHSPASIRVNQGASFYGFVGIWLLQATALCALVDLLRRPSRRAKAVFVVALLLTVGASFALQLRSLAAFAVLAGIVAFMRLRVPTRRQVAVAVAVLAIGAVALAALQQVRAYTTNASTREAIARTVDTPIWAMYVSDLSTFDNFLAFEQLVPESIAYLDGSSIAEIPAALVPRSLWPDKPLGIEFTVSAYLYPGVYVAVPISLHGELYWNGGWPLVALGLFVMGLIMGAYGRAALHATGVRSLVVYAVTFPFVHAFLRSALATMTGNIVLALVGTTLALMIVSDWRPWERMRCRHILRRRVAAA
jgi:hypothetical protein